jgi:hypothetical protein
MMGAKTLLREHPKDLRGLGRRDKRLRSNHKNPKEKEKSSSHHLRQRNLKQGTENFQYLKHLKNLKHQKA